MSPSIDTVVAALNKAGFQARAWTPRSGEARIYVKSSGTDAGYITPADFSGGNGTCKKVTRRAGTVAEILRSLA